MANQPQVEPPMLTGEQIRAEIGVRLQKYRDRSLLEQFALFMGMAQVMELALKSLLSRRYGIDLDSLEKSTLGQVKGALQEKGLRGDFIAYLESVVTYRNHMAHSFMADAFMTREMFGQSTRYERRELDKGIYELEQLFVLYEWTEAHDAWGDQVP